MKLSDSLMHLWHEAALLYPQKFRHFSVLHRTEHINCPEIDVHACRVANSNGAILRHLDFLVNSRIFTDQLVFLFLSENYLIVVFLVDIVRRVLIGSFSGPLAGFSPPYMDGMSLNSITALKERVEEVAD